MYKCIILDIDSTIIKSEHVVAIALRKYMKERFNQEISSEESASLVGLSTEYVFNFFGITENLEDESKIINRMINDMSDLIIVFDGMEETIKALHKAGFFLGLVSSKTMDEFEQDFPRFGLSNYFSEKTLANETINHKPNPDPLLKFLEKSGFKPEEVLYIGDTVYDYKAAIAAGIDFGLAIWGCADDADIIHPTYQLAHPKDILSLVKLVSTPI